MQSAIPGSNLGLAVSIKSDLNNDGCNDIVISSQEDIYIIYGSSSFAESFIVQLTNRWQGL